MLKTFKIANFGHPVSKSWLSPGGGGGGGGRGGGGVDIITLTFHSKHNGSLQEVSIFIQHTVDIIIHLASIVENAKRAPAIFGCEVNAGCFFSW